MLVGLGLFGFCGAQAMEAPEIPVKGMVTMVDLGVHECIPCKLMEDIPNDWQRAYQGRAAAIFVDDWKDRQAAARFGMRVMPTQIFDDTKDTEVFRHGGSLDKKSIGHVFTKLGVQ